MKSLIFLYLVACGNDPDYETHQGMRVFTVDGFPTMKMVESSCAATILAVGGEGWKAFEGLELSVQNEVIVLGGGQKANGLYSREYNSIIVHRTNDCWARNAFVHELIHLFQWRRDRKEDSLHEDTRWWGWKGIEGKAESFAALNECPEDGPLWVNPETNKPIGGW